MQYKILTTFSKRTLLIIIIVEFIISSVSVFYLVLRNFNPSTSLVASSQTHNHSLALNNNITISNSDIKPSFGLPLRLKIPIIGVDSAVEYVGLTVNGAMDTPKNQADVAWYQLGKRPGENGRAVIAGHYGWKGKKESAFDNLYKLRTGDKIYVEDDEGYTIIFVVSGNRRYNKDVVASEVFTSTDGKAYLSLITCEGEWDKVSKSYPSRLVVFAEKE
ncbi:MAG: peptidase C60 sortase A and B [uncultured bacterium]|uniref:class F sortase n=1 Tax=Sediminibacterium sp. TaxID=1917865 RepID=UPI000285C7F7|nr:class F sortase [Sediminibacterium sp.]EKD43438.1 MAG: peptidase C60 sortase A and B [uncultured bacterium]HLD54616.1 class F sortase [Sediminibacterium sp.]